MNDELLSAREVKEHLQNIHNRLVQINKDCLEINRDIGNLYLWVQEAEVTTK